MEHYRKLCIWGGGGKNLNSLIYLNETKEANQKFLLPIDTKQLNKNQVLFCANTHVLNLAVNTIGGAVAGTALNHIFTKTVPTVASIAKNFLFNLKVGGFLAILQGAEQVFARDFLLYDKRTAKANLNRGYMDLREDICDDLEGMTIRSIADGVVVGAEKMKGKYGNVVMIQHSKHLYSCYAHLATKGILVSQGDKVKRGQTIGLAGNTGNSSAPHLHFELTFFNPNKTIINVGRRLTNFAPFDYIAISDTLPPMKIDPQLIINADKLWKRNESGEIPAWCFIKSIR